MNSRDIVKLCLLLLSSMLALTGCIQLGSTESYETVVVDQGAWLARITTDKAAYSPGEPVKFDLSFKNEVKDGTLLVRYKHLADPVHEEEFQVNSGRAFTWEWTPKDDDFIGYMVEVYLKKGKDIVDRLNIAVDVSSDWTKFPRYGYLADFPQMAESQQRAVIERLNRFRINGIQFYDWQDKHHVPLKLENGEVASSWLDIANRTVSRNTVDTYIKLAHEKNMKAMNYNLLFGANENYEEDGVKKEWGLYKSPNQSNQDHHPLPGTWKSSIYLMDPSNLEWQQYIFDRQKEVFEHLAFDGWHVDQLGHRGTLWNWEGERVDLAKTYGPFMDQAKKELDVYLALNSVSMYGAEEIARSSVDFIYVEAWDQRNYKDLKDIVDVHSNITDGKLNTVLAAYMNYELAGKTKGFFNTPGVLLTDAVIFASGGAHIELGENMLGREYFPDKSLKIPVDLERQLIRYYDFSVAYQNLLRDGAVEIEKEVKSDDLLIRSNPILSTVWNFSKHKDNKEILHFINLTNATSFEWKDSMGTQTEPEWRENISITVNAEKEAKKVWMASPDVHDGTAFELDFEQDGNEISFTLPSLKYWNMVVIEY